MLGCSAIYNIYALDNNFGRRYDEPIARLGKVLVKHGPPCWPTAPVPPSGGSDEFINTGQLRIYF